MDWNWFLSLIYGFLSGFTSLLPVSADAHQILFQEMTGVSDQVAGFRLACHLAALLALLTICRKQMLRFRRERRIAAVPARRRRRQPDVSALKEDRFWRTACIFAALAAIGGCFLRPYVNGLWLMAILLFASGLLLYLPQFFRSGNKNAETVSGLDSLLMGLAYGIAPLPGVSGFAGAMCVASVRGLDRQFAVENCLLLLIAVFPVLIGADIVDIIAHAGALFSAGWVFLYFLAAAAAFAGACLAVKLVRFLAVRVGFSGLTYYCWGLALFTFALYLMI